VRRPGAVVRGAMAFFVLDLKKSISSAMRGIESLARKI
jgi:hypothetical protein